MKEKPPSDIYTKSVEVDFDDPRIQELLRKTESLRLDQRGQLATRAALVRRAADPHDPGVGATQIGPETAGRIILAAEQMFAPGEDLVLHFRGEGRGGIYRVETSRPGRRQEDAAQHIFITYALRQA